MFIALESGGNLRISAAINFVSEIWNSAKYVWYYKLHYSHYYIKIYIYESIFPIMLILHKPHCIYIYLTSFRLVKQYYSIGK